MSELSPQTVSDSSPPLVFEEAGSKVTAEKQDHCIVKMTIETSTAFVEEAQKKAIKELKSNISIPGFRKGKVPNKIILQNYAKEVESETKDTFFRNGVNLAIRLSNIIPYDIETVKPHKAECSVKSGGIIVTTYEFEPVTPSIDFSSLNPPAYEYKPEPVTEEELEEELLQLQLSFCEWLDEEERPVKSNDWVVVGAKIIDIDPPAPLWDEERLHLIQKETAPWLYDALIGMKVGESKECTTAPSKEASEIDQKIFVPRQCEITVKNIQTPKLKELGAEEFAKLQVPNLEELKKSAVKRVAKNYSTKAEQSYNKQIKIFLLEKFGSFDLPKSTYDEDLKVRQEGHLIFLKRANHTQEMIAQGSETRDQLIQELTNDWLHLFFLARAHSDLLNLSFSQEEMYQHYAMEIYFPKATPLIHNKMTPDQINEKILKDMCVEKLLDFVAKIGGRG